MGLLNHLMGLLNHPMVLRNRSLAITLPSQVMVLQDPATTHHHHPSRPTECPGQGTGHPARVTAPQEASGPRRWTTHRRRPSTPTPHRAPLPSRPGLDLTLGGRAGAAAAAATVPRFVKVWNLLFFQESLCPSSLVVANRNYSTLIGNTGRPLALGSRPQGEADRRGDPGGGEGR